MPDDAAQPAPTPPSQPTPHEPAREQTTDQPTQRTTEQPTDQTHSRAPGPPPTARHEHIEVLQGHRVEDPYRWLEAPAHDPQVSGFIDAQDAAARTHLDALPARSAFADQLTQLWDHPRRSAPWRRGDRWFQFRNDGLQEQDVLWSAPAEDTTAATSRGALPAEGCWSVLLDPSSWSEDGTVALSGVATSDDGVRLAVGRSEAGSDWTTWRVLDVATGELLPDVVPWSKFGPAAWLPDASGFLYTAYEPPAQGDEHAAANRHQQVRLHRVGTPAGEDVLVHTCTDEPEWGFHPQISHDGAWVVLTVTRGTDPETGVQVAALGPDGTTGNVDTLLQPGRALFEPLGVVGDELLVLTDLDAPLGRVVAVALPGHEPAQGSASYGTQARRGDDTTALREVVAEGQQRLLDARLVGAEHATARLVGAEHPTAPANAGAGAHLAPTDDRGTAADSGPAGWLVLHRLHHATSQLEVVAPTDGAQLGTVKLPWPVTVTGMRGGRRDDTLYLGISSFTAPEHLLACHLPTMVTRDVWRPDGYSAAERHTERQADHHADRHADRHAEDGLRTAPGDTPGPFAEDRLVSDPATSPPASTNEQDGEVVVEQVHVHHDGVAVPLFLIHRRDVVPDGCRPTVLWGYGGFDIPVTPMHRPGWSAWVAAGGVLAVACLRGGGEYGRTWHDDGRRERKTNVFDDALACAAWLTGRRRAQVHARALSPHTDADAVWTRTSQLGIEGRSNGGLLVGACLTREPTAFGSAVPEVGVLDMVRFHRFTIGWAWTSDYGSPDDPDDLAVLLRYSPYHNIEVGRSYPATLITTGDTDDRVVPGHSFKFAAALQHAQGGEGPVLLRVDRSAGHGAGKPVSKLLEERADVLAFHATHLGLELAAPSSSPADGRDER